MIGWIQRRLLQLMRVDLDEMYDQADRLDDLIDDYLGVSEPDSERSEPVSN